MTNHKISKGEKWLSLLLQNNKINFKKEVSFSDLNGMKNTPLRFDFAIYRNNLLLCLIEIDGQQHFKYTPYFHKNVFDFQKRKEWDRRKNAYCLLHKIPLFRIPYWDIEKISLSDIFTNNKYRVISKYHNDYLINGGVK